ncbi:MAG: GLPGLI family protein [Ginsengibacter sp.]|jgi:GLPGLI family protein
MMRTIFLFVALGAFFQVKAQQFIDKGKVEYEVRTNIKKTMGSGFWAELMKDKVPDFKTGYFSLTFADNKSVFKFDHWDNSKLPSYLTASDEEDVWYMDRNTAKLDMQKNIYGSNLNISDSIPKLKWKLSNENRMIAGFNCRKAEAVIFDSVYIFAFYTEEITYSGGPCSINGLPGLIMGLTIPRLYTSWIATKVEVTGINEKNIKPASAKKPMDMKAFQALLNERNKGWSDKPDEDKEYKEQIARFFWWSYL